MEKIIYKEKIEQYPCHTFYCDDCGMPLGESDEYDDGYYEPIEEYEWKMYVDHTLSEKTNDWYRVKKNFCPKCREKFVQNIINSLTALGFKKESIWSD